MFFLVIITLTSRLFPTATPPETSVVIGVSHDRSIHQGICLNDRGICTQKEVLLKMNYFYVIFLAPCNLSELS